MATRFQATPRSITTVDTVARIVLAIGNTLAACIVIAGAALTSFNASAAERDDYSGGGLLLRAQEGDRTQSAPVLSTDVSIDVSGVVARARVRQSFRNPNKEWYEGIYVFPLPENAAVDHLRMKIGDRVVVGEIKERQAARATYEQAKQSGRRSTLIEQERENMFTASVANIGPGETIEVEIEYQQTLAYEQGRFSLRFPMVVGPRYIPGVPVSAPKPTDWAAATDQVPDADRITPPVLRPSEGKAPVNPVTLRVMLDAGVPLTSVESRYHPIRVRELDRNRREVELDGSNYATRDFELTWTVAADRAPKAAFFVERGSGQQDGRRYGLLMLLPPRTAVAHSTLPREVIFVIDTSGSMYGASIAQAKEALELAVRRLGPRDRFNIVEFNSAATRLFGDARPANDDNIDVATRWVRGLKAQGGTEMALALNLALNGAENPDRVRQVIFLTDGAVGNEEALFRLIRQQLGDSRLFTVGIGSAPNSYFMTKAARMGRGTFTYIGKIEEVKEKMTTLFGKLESPVLKNVRIDWPAGVKVEAWPQRLPDLYLGEPLVVSAALDRVAGNLKVSGMLGDSPWETSVALERASAGRGMGVLWAREKVASLTDSLREGASEDDVRGKVVAVALEHHLVTRYTSLVAVDRTPARPDGAALKQAGMPTNLPDGWNYGAVFGELPQGATNARFNLLVGFVLLLAATLLYVARQRFLGAF